MRAHAYHFALLLFGLVGPIAAGEVHFAGVTVVIPSQLSGPVRATPDQASETLAFTSVGAPDVPRVVLQLTRYTMPGIPTDLSDADIAKGTTQYLLQMLQGIERRRASYAQTAPEHVQLGGRPGSRASWTGTLDGAPTNGVMYCLIVGPNIVLIHAFGGGTRPSDLLGQVLRNVERLSIVAPNKSMERTREG